MGLINNDSMQTKSDLQVSPGAYMSIGSTDLEIQRVSSGEYQLVFINSVWKDLTAHETNVRTFQKNSYTISISEAQLSESMYAVAYAYLKTVYPNTTDA